MSYYEFYINNLEIYTGWDEPLQYHFLVISDKNSKEIFFSNLWLENPGSMTVDSIIKKCREFKIEIPQEIIQNLHADKGTPPDPNNQFHNEIREFMRSEGNLGIYEFSYNKELAKQLKQNIDPCSFGTVKNYLKSQGSGINHILLLNDPYLLEQVGSFLLDSNGNNLVPEEFFTKNICRLGLDSEGIEKVIPSSRKYTFLLDSISDLCVAEVLLVNDIYLVKLKDGVWE